MARLVWCSNQLAKQSSFVRISISRFTWITRSLIHFSKQRGPNKRQACRIKKVLPLVLFFFLIVDITLQCNIWSDSDTVSDEKSSDQDLNHVQLLKDQ